MRLRNIPGARDIIENHTYVVKKPEEVKGLWRQRFGNGNPIHVEIGMGKGRFIMDMAALHEDINYIGIEMYSSVLLRALQKLDALEEKPRNLLFLCMDARQTPEVFGEGEADRIYLNFSDPWPKDRHAQRRLTSRQFLARYDKFLKNDGCIEFKTDNRDLFDFSLAELDEAGWRCKQYTYDLHSNSEMMEANVMTEYEEKFSALGNPICKYIISRHGI